MERWVGDIEADDLLEGATKVWCGVFKCINDGRLVSFSPNNGSDYIRDMLSFLDTVPCLIMHNGVKYDWPLLKKIYGYVYKGVKVDTLILSRLFNPKRMSPPNCPNKRAPHSVEAWGYRVGRGKPEYHNWKEFTPEMLHRCTEDVHIQHKIYEALLKEAKESGGSWDKAIPLTMKLFEYLQKQEEYGWLVDQEHIKKSIAVLDRWINRIDRVLTPLLPVVVEVEEGKEVGGQYKHVAKPFKKDGNYNAKVIDWINSLGVNEHKIVGGPFTRIGFRKVNLNSNAEVKDFLLSEGWEPKEWNYANDGSKSSAKLNKDDPFEGVNSGVGRLVAKRVQCRQRKSILEGFFPLIRDDGRIASVVSNLAVTGRATHSGIVNIPGEEAFFGRYMRQCFVAKDGYNLVGTDSDGCQNRMLAARVGDPNFTKILLEGKKADKTSIHYVNQRAIKEIAGIDVTYHKSKNLNYAFMFGAQNKKLEQTSGVQGANGEKIREALLSVSPGFADLITRLTAEWRSHAKKRWNPKWNKFEYFDGWVVGLDGRPILIPLEHQILVYVLQSDEAIMMSAAYCMFHKWAEEKGWIYGVDYGTVCWYHDEYTVECKVEITQDVAALTKKSIEWAGNFYKIAIPHKGDAKIGKNWYEIH